MPVVGTAGHVDHGKSTLVVALTGRDPDRWEEEKRRGLTIDLGFSWAELMPGLEVSFVDVPGHERYAKNMLAGIEAVDVALFVVAADEGWMPQSEEHLAVLDLLGVDRGVVALTKVDRVDGELVELATLEVEEHLEGTSLAGAPVLPVSAQSGAGIEDVRDRLAALAAGAGRPDGVPRMWIDRAFSVTGAGTVVTGTLLGGPFAVGDRLEVLPGGGQGRIRGIQSHERDVDHVEPHRRVALNIVGIERDQLHRGALLAGPGARIPTTRVLADMRAARYVEELTDRGSYHLHVGSGGHPVRIRMLEPDLALLDLPAPLPLAAGDPFVLRDTGRRLVVGGGTVLDPDPRGRGRDARRSAAVLRSARDPDTRAAALLAVRGRDRAARIAAHSGGGTAPEGVALGDEVFTPERITALRAEARRLVDAYHRDHPLRPGIPGATLAERLGVGTGVLDALVDADAMLTSTDAAVRLADHTPGRTPEQEAAWEAAKAMLVEAGPGAAPRADELGLGTELLHALVREGELVRIAPDLVYLPEWIERLSDTMHTFEAPFTVSEFKDATGLSRKYAVPLLEWADGAGVTVRMGDRRRPRG